MPPWKLNHIASFRTDHFRPKLRLMSPPISKGGSKLRQETCISLISFPSNCIFGPRWIEGNHKLLCCGKTTAAAAGAIETVCVILPHLKLKASGSMLRCSNLSCIQAVTHTSHAPVLKVHSKRWVSTVETAANKVIHVTPFFFWSLSLSSRLFWKLKFAQTLER